MSASVAALVIGLYFVGYRSFNAAPGDRYVKPGLFAYTETALKYLASGFGGAANRPWWQLPVFLIAVILLASAICLIGVLARRARRDPRAVGLACYMVSCLGVAWVVGMGRYAWGDTVLDSRYAAASVVLILGSYFVWEFYGPPAFVPLGRMLLFTAAATFLAANNQLGIRQGVTLRDAERAFLRDLQAAEPIPRLVAHHSWVTYYYHDKLERYLRELRDARIVPYDRLPPDRPFPARMRLAEPTEIHQIDWKGDGGRILGPGAYLKFALDTPRFVSGVSFRFSLVDPSGMMPAMKVRWYSETKAGIEQSNCQYASATGEEASFLVYIDDRISQLLILPNNRESSFRIAEVELLLPEPGPDHAEPGASGPPRPD